MRIIKTLLWSDFLDLKTWFKKSWSSKLVVAGSFAGLGSMIVWAGYNISLGYFRLLAGFENFGRMTAEYSIHASIIVILWILLSSAIVSFSGLFVAPGRRVLFLLTQPYVSGALGIWMMLKSLAGNLGLLLIIFSPIVLAYGRVEGIGGLDLWIGFWVAVVLISILITVLGAFVSLIILPLVQKRIHMSAILGLLVFFGGLVAILKSVFPANMAKLYDATPTQFMQIFSTLPLNNPNLPTFWLTSSITAGFSNEIYFVSLFALGIIMILGRFIYTKVPQTFINLNSRTNSPKFAPSVKIDFFRVRCPVFIKDLIGVIRNPKESGYIVFLGSVAAFFFVSLSVLSKQMRGDWRTEFLLFTYAWIVFFASAFFLRFVFPRLTVEGKAVWNILTAPEGGGRILGEKMMLAIAAWIISLVFTVIVWFLIGFAKPYLYILLPVTILSLLFISLANILLGTLNPDFKSDSDPEKVSTSPAGLATLFVSLIFGVGGGHLIRLGIIKDAFFQPAVFLYLLLSTGILIMLLGSALKSVKSYEY